MGKTDKKDELQSIGLSSLVGIFQARSFQITLGFSIVLLVIAAVLGQEGIPQTRPGLTSIASVMGISLVILLVSFLIIGVAAFITRKRAAPDFGSRVPDKKLAAQETMLLVMYGAVVLVIGGLLGVGSLHLHGAVLGATRELTSGEVIRWMAFYFVALAAVPYIAFRARGYSNQSLSLRSSNRKNDAILVLVILAIQIPLDLTLSTVLSLTASQAAIGLPLTTIVHLLGTALPVMIFVQCLLVPRYLKLTGSVVTTTILGGLTYAGLHVWEYWTVYDSLSNASLSLIFVFITFFGPGMVKAFLTLRTGNAWVHVVAFHAITPHVTIDTPNIVRAFKIK